MNIVDVKHYRTVKKQSLFHSLINLMTYQLHSCLLMILITELSVITVIFEVT